MATLLTVPNGGTQSLLIAASSDAFPALVALQPVSQLGLQQQVGGGVKGCDWLHVSTLPQSAERDHEAGLALLLQCVVQLTLCASVLLKATVQSH